MLKRMWVAGAFVLATVVAQVARADVIHVNNITGDDRFNGLAAEIRSRVDGPVATIARAFDIATGTDSIAIANTGDPYVESIYLTRSDQNGTPAYPLLIEGNGATLRGTKQLPRDVWRQAGDGTYRYQPFRKGHYQLLVNGQLATEQTADRAAASPPALEPLQWCAHRGLVYFRIEPRKFITDYEFDVPALEVGITLHNARNIVIRNLHVEYFRLDGVAVTGNSRNVRLLNVRSVANGRAGLSVAGTSRVEVGGLEFKDNREAERLVLLKGHITELDPSTVPRRPEPASWDVSSGRFVRITPPDSIEKVMSTASGPTTDRK